MSVLLLPASERQYIMSTIRELTKVYKTNTVLHRLCHSKLDAKKASTTVQDNATRKMTNLWLHCLHCDGKGFPAEACPIASIDPRNNMPIEPNQRPVRDQKKYISTYRLQSNIPKGGTDSTWLYPSPQMFYNGMCLASLLERTRFS